MTNLGQISLMNLPDEIIEVVTSFLSFEELMRLTRVGNKRLEKVAKRTLKNRSCKLFQLVYGVIVNSNLKNNLQLNQIIQIIFSINIFQILQSSVDTMVFGWMMLKWYQSKRIPFQ